MKILKIIILLLINPIYSLHAHIYDPILVAIIMVKNEEHVIKETLQPFVDGGVDAFFVFDTGSTDKTIEITQDFFQQNNITGGYIEQEPFIDFATSRNRALELAHKKFPNAAFMIMFDAEWYINDAQELLNFCKKCINMNDNCSCYHIRVLNDYTDFYTPRLIRCNRNIQFKGVVHEAIECPHIKAPENIYFKWLPQQVGIEKSHTRHIRDRDILLKEYNNNPSTRTLFYLARTCEDLGDLEKAYFLYKKRIKQIGWDEEDFISYYRLAQTIEKLSYENKKYTWSEALHYYLKAYEMRPHRAESLISIADYYIGQDQLHLAFLYALQACRISYPQHDILFVEKYNYIYYRYEQLARCAWYCDEFEIGEWAAHKAVEARPEYEIAQFNVQCYLNRH